MFFLPRQSSRCVLDPRSRCRDGLEIGKCHARRESRDIFFENENGANRARISALFQRPCPGKRVHCCLHFLVRCNNDMNATNELSKLEYHGGPQQLSKSMHDDSLFPSLREPRDLVFWKLANGASRAIRAFASLVLHHLQAIMRFFGRSTFLTSFCSKH